MDDGRSSRCACLSRSTTSGSCELCNDMCEGCLSPLLSQKARVRAAAARIAPWLLRNTAPPASQMPRLPCLIRPWPLFVHSPATIPSERPAETRGRARRLHRGGLELSIRAVLPGAGQDRRDPALHLRGGRRSIGGSWRATCWLKISPLTLVLRRGRLSMGHSISHPATAASITCH